MNNRSRSLLQSAGHRILTLKRPTDHPFARSGAAQELQTRRILEPETPHSLRSRTQEPSRTHPNCRSSVLTRKQAICHVRQGLSLIRKREVGLCSYASQRALFKQEDHRKLRAVPRNRARNARTKTSQKKGKRRQIACFCLQRVRMLKVSGLQDRPPVSLAGRGVSTACARSIRHRHDIPQPFEVRDIVKELILPVERLRRVALWFASTDQDHTGDTVLPQPEALPVQHICVVASVKPQQWLPCGVIIRG